MHFAFSLGDRVACYSLHVGEQVVEPQAEYACQMQSTWRAMIRSDRSLPFACKSALAWTCKAGPLRESAYFGPTAPPKEGKVVDGCMQLAESCPMTSETRLLRLMYPTYSLPPNKS